MAAGAYYASKLPRHPGISNEAKNGGQVRALEIGEEAKGACAPRTRPSVQVNMKMSAKPRFY